MRRLLPGALLLWSCTTAAAEIPPAPPELEAFARFVMAESPPSAEIARRVADLDSVISAYADPAAREVFVATRAHLAGFAERGNGRTAAADVWFVQAVESAERANALEPSSEGFRVLADAHNQLLDIRNTGYKMFNAWQARDNAVRACELDQSNPLAHLSAAAFFVSAPPIAGGDIQRGAEHLEHAKRLGADSEYVRFLIAVWEGRLDAKLGRVRDAELALAQAYAIYPGNWWLMEIAGELGVEVGE
ncbi:MAG: hypothetical protein ACOCYX_02970 [Spirochaetota bacterium]